MTDTPQAPFDISVLRKDIDRVDTALLELIAERLGLNAKVRASKAGVGVWRPSREESHVRNLARRAGDMPAELVSTIMAELMSASLALQGPMRLHVALEGDTLSNKTLVRDRFGAALPQVPYPTASAALGMAASEREAVAILPAPGGMDRWWTALCKGGAMDHLHILAALPRTGNAPWPKAVAVSDTPIDASGHDVTLISVLEDDAESLNKALPNMRLHTESGAHRLFVYEGFLAPDDPRVTDIKSAKVIGVLPKPLGANQ